MSGHTHQGHGHAHIHPLSSSDHLNRAFRLGIFLNLLFVAVEFAAGLWLSSMALISDAGHNLSDVVGLVLALLAFRLMRLKPNTRYTYGYKKSTVLVSLLNACILLVAVGMILVSSIQKLQHPEPIPGGAVAWVAGIGILVNAFTAWLFMKDKDRDLNVKGAYLHMAADALVSVGVLVSGLIIRATGWNVIDPVIGIVIAGVILVSTARLLHASLRLSLDGVPEGIDPETVCQAMRTVDPGVVDVHHVHIWALSTTENALTAHVRVADWQTASLIKRKIKQCLESFHIQHVTLELETLEETCSNGACEVNPQET